MTVALESHSNGVVLPVKALPGARRNAVLDEHGGRLKVAVTVPAEKGKANDAIQELIAESLGLKRNQVQLMTGATASMKRFLVTGISLEDLQKRVDRLLNK